MRKFQFIVLSIFMVAFMCSCSGGSKATPVVPQPVLTNPAINWEGIWTQTDESDGSKMVATIQDGVIKINIVSTDMTSLFWQGTWPAQPVGDKQNITSIGDREVLNQALLASQETTKPFVYNKGVISFTFSILNVSRTIHMERHA